MPAPKRARANPAPIQPEQRPSDEIRPSTSAELARIIRTRVGEAVTAKQTQSQVFLDCYNDYMAKPRAEDTKGTGAARATITQGIFLRQTRSKARAAQAKIKDSLFGQGLFPIDTAPYAEDMKEFADHTEEIVLKLLEECRYREVLGDAINGLCVYGTDLVVGPFVKEHSRKTFQKGYEAVVDPQTGMQIGTRSKIVEDEYTCDLPYFEHARQLDYYPDEFAEHENDGLGGTWVTRPQKNWLRNKLSKDSSYSNLAEAFSSSNRLIPAMTGSEAVEAASNTPKLQTDKRAEVIHYFGLLPKQLVSELDAPEHAEYEDEDLVESIAVLINGVVVKVGENILPVRPVYRCCYEFTPHEFWGVGVAENNFAQQKIANAAFRLYLEGKGYALLKTATVDRSKFKTGEDFKRFPGKLYETRDGLTPEEIKTAIIYHDVIDVTDGWEKVIAISEKFSDDETSISKYTQGTDAKHLNNTATGISMIMNASSLPLKEVIQNIDDNFIVRPVKMLLHWCLENLDPETVSKIMDDDHASTWAAVQRFYKEKGNTDFIQWKATGASTFVAKEVLLTKLQGFLQIVATSPQALEMVDMRELLEQIWEVANINRESVVYDEETLAKRRAEQPDPMKLAQEQQHVVFQQKMAEVTAKIEGSLREVMAGVQGQLEEARMEQSVRFKELQLKERELDIKIMALNKPSTKKV